MDLFAKSKLNMAKIAESQAKVDDLEAGAERKNMESDLDLVRMMVELEDLQFNQFRSSFEHAQAIKQANRLDREEEMLNKTPAMVG